MGNVHWLGNRVDIQEFPDSELTLMQWARPWHGTKRGYVVVGAEERWKVERAIVEATTGDRVYPKVDAAGQPADLEAYLDEVLGRTVGRPTSPVEATE